MKRLAILFVMFTVILLAGCGQQEPPLRTKRVEVIRVFMSSPVSYSVMVEKEDKSAYLLSLGGCYHSNDIKFFRDVSPECKNFFILEEEPGGYWYQCTSCSSIDGVKYTIKEIHLQSEKEIEGGGWNHGKFGSGQTIPIE